MPRCVRRRRGSVGRVTQHGVPQVREAGADLVEEARRGPGLDERRARITGPTTLPSGDYNWTDFTINNSKTLTIIGPATIVVSNFTPVPRPNYRLGVPAEGFYREILNSDATAYWGSNVGNYGGVPTEAIPWSGHPHSLRLTLPPLGAVFLKPATLGKT